MAWEKSIFIGCTHGDLVCPDAVSVLKQFLAEWKPKHRIHLGDLWDFRGLRGGANPEERAEDIRYDYNCGIELLDFYKPQILTLGNHDHRIWRVAKETSNGVLADLMAKFCDDAETDLRKRRIKWSPWGVEQGIQFPIGNIWLNHGYSSTMYPAKKAFEEFGDSASAHVHKPSRYEARHKKGGKAFTVGTMADIKKMSYANGYPAKLGWRNSFEYGMHNTKTGAWQSWSVVKEGKDWISPLGVLTA
tara:strand:+ start:677 stop:1414 length:738 start_codon:yes stop_codon:yes gene_type:complete